MRLGKPCPVGARDALLDAVLCRAGDGRPCELNADEAGAGRDAGPQAHRRSVGIHVRVGDDQGECRARVLAIATAIDLDAVRTVADFGWHIDLDAGHRARRRRTSAEGGSCAAGQAGAVDRQIDTGVEATQPRDPDIHVRARARLESNGLAIGPDLEGRRQVESGNVQRRFTARRGIALVGVGRRQPVGRAVGDQRGTYLLRSGARPARVCLGHVVQGRASRHVRRGHRRATHHRQRRVRLAVDWPARVVGQGRPDAFARRNQVDVRTEIAERREGVVGVVVAAISRSSAGRLLLALPVRHCRDGDDLVIRPGRIACRVATLVACGDDHRHTGVIEPADGLVQQVGVGLAAVTIVGQAAARDAHVDDLDLLPPVRIMHSRHVVKAADHPRPPTVARAVEHLDCPQPGALCDSGDAQTVLLRRGDATDVSAVAEAG